MSAADGDRFFVNVTDAHGTLLVRVEITGSDLRRQAARVALAETIRDEMGGMAVARCAEAQQ